MSNTKHSKIVKVLMELQFISKENDWNNSQKEIRATYDAHRILNLMDKESSKEERSFKLVAILTELECTARFAHKNGADSNDLIDIFDKTIDKIEELFPLKLKTDEDIIFTTRKVCFFKLKNGKYMTENNIEITSDMLVKYPHVISELWSYIIVD